MVFVDIAFVCAWYTVTLDALASCAFSFRFASTAWFMEHMDMLMRRGGAYNNM